MRIKPIMQGKLKDNRKCCKYCEHVKRLEGYETLAECGLTKLTVNINVLEICKYYEETR
jgi:hypothetical protein